MDLTPPVELHHAMALQSLALPSTLTLCFTSMLRERAIGDRDEKGLIRLYKQHAFALELLQLFVILMAVGLVTGNTVAALEARSLVVKYANEEITASIVRSALVRNLWLLLSALCNLICVNMLDSWSLPQSVEDLTDPLLRLTREAIVTYIHAPTATPCSTSSSKPSTPNTSKPPSLATSTISLRSTLTDPPPQPPPRTPSPSPSTKPTIWPTHQPPAPPAPPLPPLSPTKPTAAMLPHYQSPTKASALRASIKAPNSPVKERKRKRSVTFDLAPKGAGSEDGKAGGAGGVMEGKGKRGGGGLVGRRVREFEESLVERTRGVM